MKAKTFFVSLFVFVGLSAIIVGFMVYLNTNRISNDTSTNVNISVQPSVAPSLLIGYVYSSGLSTGPAYQITYLNTSESFIRPEIFAEQIDGAFLNGEDSRFAEYWGRCVQVTGLMSPELNTKNFTDTYYRSNILVDEITLSDRCNVVLNSYPEYEQTVGTYSGTIEKNTRPTPDVFYDYKLVLTTPYMSTNNASGTEQLVTEIVLAPLTKESFDRLQANLGKVVTVKGEWMSGFVDIDFFLINQIY